MKYIKLFDDHLGYEEFVDSGTMVKPNVSHCVQENEIHYNSLIDKELIVKYVPELLYVLIEEGEEIGQNVYGTQIRPTQLYHYDNYFGSLGVNIFSKVEIDNVEVSVSDLDTSEGTYLFSTEGEHTVKYTLKDPTFIGMEFDEQTEIPTKFGATFMNCSCIESVEIPNSVTSIGISAFYSCNNLTSITIPDSVTSIGEYAFIECSGLTSAVIPDSVITIGNNAFCGTNLDAATQAKILAINPNAFCSEEPIK